MSRLAHPFELNPQHLQNRNSINSGTNRLPIKPSPDGPGGDAGSMKQMAPHAGVTWLHILCRSSALTIWPVFCFHVATAARFALKRSLFVFFSPRRSIQHFLPYANLQSSAIAWRSRFYSMIAVPTLRPPLEEFVVDRPFVYTLQKL